MLQNSEVIRLYLAFDWTPRMYIASPTIGPRCRRLGEHAKLIHRGISALSCGTQPPRGLRGRRLSNFLHRRPDVQFIASRGILHRADICSLGKCAIVRGRIDVSAIAISMRAIRVILDPGGCINQRRELALSGSSFYYALLFTSLALPLSLFVCLLDKYWWPINFGTSMHVKFCFRRRKIRLYILISHYEVQMNFLKK